MGCKGSRVRIPPRRPTSTKRVGSHQEPTFFFSITCFGAVLKKTLLMLCLLSLNAQADWRLLHTESDKSQYFIEPTNTALVDGFHRVWVLHNLPQANPHGTRSFRSIEEYDCNLGQARLMHITAYASEMGLGEPLGRRSGTGAWAKPEAGSVDQLIMSSVCKTP